MPINYILSKKPVLYSLFSLFMLFTGCISVDSQVYLNADGSGKIIVKELISGDSIDMLANLGSTGQIPSIDITSYFTEIDEEELETRVTEISSGIEYSSVKAIKLSDGTVGRSTVYTFKDINKVRIFGKNTRNRDLMTFSYNGKALKIRTNFTESEEIQVMQKSKMLHNIPSYLRFAFTGMAIEVILKTEKQIKGSNAYFRHPDNKSITFFKVDIGRLIATPDAIDAVGSYTRNNPDKYHLTLAPYSDWMQIEYQNEITIDF